MKGTNICFKRERERERERESEREGESEIDGERERERDGVLIIIMKKLIPQNTESMKIAKIPKYICKSPLLCCGGGIPIYTNQSVNSTSIREKNYITERKSINF